MLHKHQSQKGDPLVQPPAKAGSPKSRLHRITARWVLNISRRDNTASLGSLFKSSVIHKVKEIFPFYSDGAFVFQFEPVALTIWLGATEKSHVE